MSILDALKLKNFETEINGLKVSIRRPSALDMIAAAEFHATNPSKLGAWLVWNHLMDGDKKAFDTIDEVLASDGHAINMLADIIDKLYAEGGNSVGQHNKC